MEYKGYLIKPSKTDPKCYTVATVGRGGKIPDVLAGLFTSPSVAIGFVDTYLEAKEKKGKTDGEESGKGGS